MNFSPQKKMELNVSLQNYRSVSYHCYFNNDIYCHLYKAFVKSNVPLLISYYRNNFNKFVQDIINIYNLNPELQQKIDDHYKYLSDLVYNCINRSSVQDVIPREIFNKLVEKYGTDSEKFKFNTGVSLGKFGGKRYNKSKRNYTSKSKRNYKSKSKRNYKSKSKKNYKSKNI